MFVWVVIVAACVATRIGLASHIVGILVVLPNCALDVSKRVAARLREAVPDGQSCSSGITSWNGKDSADEFLLAADEALYRTKGKRNGTVAGCVTPSA